MKLITFITKTKISSLIRDSKNEMIADHFDIEGKYPFLNRDVIQVFLNLSNSLKKSNYKSYFTNFLDNNNYPCNKGMNDGSYYEKSDFNCPKQLERKYKTFKK